MLETFYVDIYDRDTDTREELRFQAEDFAHAEEQAKPYVGDNELIIRIERDY